MTFPSRMMAAREQWRWIEELVLHQGIQAAGRLIKNQQLRIMLQRADDADLFPVAEGKILDLLFGIQLQPAAQLGRPGGAVLFPQAGGELQHIPDAHAGIERVVRGEVADAFQDGTLILYNIQAQHPAGTRVRADQAEQGADGRGLPGAVRSDKTEEGAFFDRQVQPVDPARFSVILCERRGEDRIVFHRVQSFQMFSGDYNTGERESVQTLNRNFSAVYSSGSEE